MSEYNLTAADLSERIKKAKTWLKRDCVVERTTIVNRKTLTTIPPETVQNFIILYTDENDDVEEADFVSIGLDFSKKKKVEDIEVLKKKWAEIRTELEDVLQEAREASIDEELEETLYEDKELSASIDDLVYLLQDTPERINDLGTFQISQEAPQMAERSPFSFTACLDHAHYRCRERVSVSTAKCNFEAQKTLDERRGEYNSIREKHPHEIPVIVQKADASQIPYAKKKLLIRPESNLLDFFVDVWNEIFQIKMLSCYLFMLVKEHKDHMFKRLMSSIYEEYKDVDGFLYLTLSGEMSDIFAEPIPSDITASTIYVTKPPCFRAVDHYPLMKSRNWKSGKSKLHYKAVRKEGYVDLIGLWFENLIIKYMKDDRLSVSVDKLCFYLVTAGLKHKQKHVNHFYKTMQGV